MMFATAAIVAALTTTGTASSIGVENGVWCAAPITLADKHLKELPVGPDLSFRGQFKDFALFVESKSGDLASCAEFLDHHAGDDGLWVIEEPTIEVGIFPMYSIFLLSLYITSQSALYGHYLMNA